MLQGLQLIAAIFMPTAATRLHCIICKFVGTDMSATWGGRDRVQSYVVSHSHRLTAAPARTAIPPCPVPTLRASVQTDLCCVGPLPFWAFPRGRYSLAHQLHANWDPRRTEERKKESKEGFYFWKQTSCQLPTN